MVWSVSPMVTIVVLTVRPGGRHHRPNTFTGLFAARSIAEAVSIRGRYQHGTMQISIAGIVVRTDCIEDSDEVFDMRHANGLPAMYLRRLIG
jgi:hypothetical protein